MKDYNQLLDEFVKRSKSILKDNLVGIYLHGSAVMGCFNEKKSDIDLVIVVKNDIPNETKKLYMDMIIELNIKAPVKGIEFSIVKRDVCKPFVYPTPFELHFSTTYLLWYQSDPEGYIEKMKGTDRDLAAHFMIIYHRGKTLYGKEIMDMFANINKDYYFDSIWNDIKNAKKEIIYEPMYIILNLCRVLAYKEKELILSKQEGGEWGIAHIPVKYRNLILDAMAEYQTGGSMNVQQQPAIEYAIYMLDQIKN